MRTSRGLVAIVLAISSVAGSLVSPAGAVPDHVREEREAGAIWLLPTGREGVSRAFMIAAWDHRDIVGTDDVVFGMAARGTCRRKERTHEDGTTSRFTSCAITAGQGVVIPRRAFRMTDLADEATVSFRAMGRAHRARWIARDPSPGLYESYEFCSSQKEEGSGHGGGIWRPAHARGHVMGVAMPRQSKMFTMILRGAIVTECNSPFQRAIDMDVLRRTGSSPLTRRVTIRL